MKEHPYKEGHKTGIEEDVQRENSQEKIAVREEKRPYAEHKKLGGIIPYAEYKELGGIINESDYVNAQGRNIETITTSDMYIAQVESMTNIAGIELKNTRGAVDPRVKLYGVLRSDKKPEGVKEHHSDMNIQSLFAEVLRMLGDTDSLEKLINVNHQVGTHCPICLKVVKSGEACR